MNWERSFEALWNRHDPFELPQEENSPFCVYAVKLNEWAEVLVTNALKDGTLVGIKQAMVQLQDKYHEWRKFVPKRHRGIPTGHQCIFHVYELAYDRLKVVELSITPPMLFIPAPPPPVPVLPPPPPPQIAGIFLGELDEE